MTYLGPMKVMIELEDKDGKKRRIKVGMAYDLEIKVDNGAEFYDIGSGPYPERMISRTDYTIDLHIGHIQPTKDGWQFLYEEE